MAVNSIMAVTTVGRMDVLYAEFAVQRLSIQLWLVHGGFRIKLGALRQFDDHENSQNQLEIRIFIS
jgi:hypothetical protein